MVSYQECAGELRSYEVGPEFHGRVDEVQRSSVRLLRGVKGIILQEHGLLSVLDSVPPVAWNSMKRKCE